MNHAFESYRLKQAKQTVVKVSKNGGCSARKKQGDNLKRKSGKFTLRTWHKCHWEKWALDILLQDKARRNSTCLKSLKKRAEKRMRCGQCHISIFPLCSIAQARFGEVRFREQETDLERKSLTFIYITQTFSTGNSWGSICLLLVLSYSLRILGTYSNNVICLFSLNRIEFWSLWEFAW